MQKGFVVLYMAGPCIFHVAGVHLLNQLIS